MLAYRCLPSPLNASPEYKVCLPVVAVRSSGKSLTTPVRVSITASDCSYFDSNVPYPAFTVTTYRPSGDTATPMPPSRLRSSFSEFTRCGLPGATPTICLLDGRFTTVPAPCPYATEAASNIAPHAIRTPLHKTRPQIILSPKSFLHSP